MSSLFCYPFAFIYLLLSKNKSFMEKQNSGRRLTEEMEVTNDRRYTLHGEVMLLVLVLLFAVFLCCIIFCLYLRRLRRAQESPENSGHVDEERDKRNFGRVGSVMYDGGN